VEAALTLMSTLVGSGSGAEAGAAGEEPAMSEVGLNCHPPLSALVFVPTRSTSVWSLKQ
jgi:hypothetical protein